MTTDEAIRVVAGDVLTFRAVMWLEPQWEFDAPWIIYAPIQRYGHRGSISGDTLHAVIEDACIDIIVGDGLIKRPGFHPSDIKEFKWRGWSVRGFARRKNAVHATLQVRFYTDDDGELAFKSTAIKESAHA